MCDRESSRERERERERERKQSSQEKVTKKSGANYEARLQAVKVLLQGRMFLQTLELHVSWWHGFMFNKFKCARRSCSAQRYYEVNRSASHLISGAVITSSLSVWAPLISGGQTPRRWRSNWSRWCCSSEIFLFRRLLFVFSWTCDTNRNRDLILDPGATFPGSRTQFNLKVNRQKRCECWGATASRRYLWGFSCVSSHWGFSF